MDFSSQELLFNDVYPNMNDFILLQNTGSFHYSASENAAFHTIEVELTNDYFWLYSNYGHRNPRPEIVINTQDGSSHENLRQTEEIEPGNQLFVLYDFNKALLYTSDSRKKAFIANVLKEKLDIQGTGVIIKNIFIDKDAFMERIRRLDSIKFTSCERNLFSNSNMVGNALKDNFGMGEPEKFTVWADYKTPMSDVIKNTINVLTNQKNEGHILGLKIIGRDDQDIEQIFNEDALTKKITIQVVENGQGLYDSTDVKQKLLHKLGEIR